MNKRIYMARAASWGLGKSTTGKEQVVVECVVLTEGAPEHSLSWYGYFTDGTVDRTIQSLRTFGWMGDDLSDLTGLDANEVDIVVEDEEYEGKVSAKVKWINKPGGLLLKAPLSADEAKSFAALMRSKIKATDAAGGKRINSKPPMAQPEPPPHTDMDIPF